MEEETIINNEEPIETDESDDSGDEVGYKAKTAKRFEELTSKLGEQTGLNEKLVEQIDRLTETVERLAKSSTKEETDEIMAELEKLDTERPESYKDLFKKFREANKKMEEREKEQEKEVSTQTEAQNLRELETQLSELEEDGLIKPEEEADFAKWCADQLQAGKSPNKYGNLFAALPLWRAETTKAPSEDVSRRAIGPSGGTGERVVKINPDELKNMSMAEAMRRARNA